MVVVSAAAAAAAAAAAVAAAAEAAAVRQRPHQNFAKCGDDPTQRPLIFY